MEKMITIDIGLGTQDILIGSEPNENSTKFVLPSPTQIIKKRVENTSGDLLVKGHTMGGGPLSGAIANHAENNEVIMTKKSARTISDDLSEVEEDGIKVINENPSKLEGYQELFLSDLISFPHIMSLLNKNDIDCPQTVGVAVQDHGVAPKGMSDRKYRFQYFKKAIREGEGLMDLVFEEKTGRFSRIDSCFDFLNNNGLNSYLMDSKIASIFGCLGENNRLIVDAGNGHFLAATCEGRRLIGLFEHHSSQLTESKIKKYLRKLVDGSIKDEEVFEDGGHGAYVQGSLETDEIIVTGPKRNLMPNDLDFKLAHPIGDVMMAGAIGLFNGINYLNQS
ncbi:hypothetical protein C9439_01460 [archaeon SCG-AAA382B04]|nr:hypothetical protein C9439_01460 [archaeon SCG-AAA382B04]